MLSLEACEVQVSPGKKLGQALARLQGSYLADMVPEDWLVV